MNRYIDFDEETDGKRYSGKDMARLGCNDCKGCHKCCTGMGPLFLTPMTFIC